MSKDERTSHDKMVDWVYRILSLIVLCVVGYGLFHAWMWAFSLMYRAAFSWHYLP